MLDSSLASETQFLEVGLAQQMAEVKANYDTYHNNDGTINWEAHGQNLWLAAGRAEREAERILFQETKPRLPRTDKGHTIDQLISSFAGRLSNGDKLTAQTYERMNLDPRISQT